MLDGINEITSLSTSKTGYSSLTEKDTFLKLFVEQLKAQDPLNPQDVSQMSAQLAQFSSLEQLINMNKNIDTLQNLLNISNNTEMISFLGKKVTLEDNSVEKLNGEFLQKISYEVDGTPTSLTLNVEDAEGNVIKSISLPVNKKGEVDLNSIDELSSLDDGIYKFSISAVGFDGSNLNVKEFTTGTVTSMFFDNNGPELKIGSLVIDPSKIKEIF